MVDHREIRRYRGRGIPILMRGSITLAFTLGAVAAGIFVACTAPLDVDTPRDRIAVNTHFGLPDILRLRPQTKTITVYESDVTAAPGWTYLTAATIDAGLDTTFNPPWLWLHGVLTADTARTPGKESIHEFHFAIDSVPLGDSLFYDKFPVKLYTSRKIGTNIVTDTLRPGDMVGKMWTKYHTTQHLVTDSLILTFGPGVSGATTVYSVVVMKFGY